MAVHKWKDAVLLYGELDISGDSNEISLMDEAQVAETTNFKSGGYRDEEPVIVGCRATLNGFYGPGFPLEKFSRDADTIDARREPFVLIPGRPPKIGGLAQAMWYANPTMFKPEARIGDVGRHSTEFGMAERFTLNGKVAAWQENLVPGASGEYAPVEIGQVHGLGEVTASLHVLAFEGSGNLTFKLKYKQTLLGTWETFAAAEDPTTLDNPIAASPNEYPQLQAVANTNAKTALSRTFARTVRGSAAGNDSGFFYVDRPDQTVVSDPGGGQAGIFICHLTDNGTAANSIFHVITPDHGLWHRVGVGAWTEGVAPGFTELTTPDLQSEAGLAITEVDGRPALSLVTNLNSLPQDYYQQILYKNAARQSVRVARALLAPIDAGTFQWPHEESAGSAVDGLGSTLLRLTAHRARGFWNIEWSMTGDVDLVSFAAVVGGPPL